MGVEDLYLFLVSRERLQEQDSISGRAGPLASKNLPHGDPFCHGYAGTYTQPDTGRGAANEFTYERYVADPLGNDREGGGGALMKARRGTTVQRVLVNGGMLTEAMPCLTYADVKLKSFPLNSIRSSA